jgi:hypothetical protein
VVSCIKLVLSSSIEYNANQSIVLYVTATCVSFLPWLLFPPRSLVITVRSLGFAMHELTMDKGKMLKLEAEPASYLELYSTLQRKGSRTPERI